MILLINFREEKEMNLKEIEIFLEEVRKIHSKIPKKEKTFMEIAGFPHYENVCSNILAFYLNPREEHKLKDIVLKSLLDIVKEKDITANTNVDIFNMNVFREYVTENGNRIDIVLQSNEIIIGIENKIMASVYNDLTDYANTLEKLNHNVVKILLSLHDESNIARENQFINITYSDFFDKLKANLASYNDRQNKWYIYLKDFIKNLECFEVEKDMEENINEWIKNHQEDIKNFYELLDIAKNSMDKKVNEYGTLLEERIPSHYKVRYWHDSDVEVGAYILLDRLGCNLDAYLTINGWVLGLNLWKKSNQVKIRQALQKNNYDIVEERNSHVYLYKLEYDYPIYELADKAKEILEMLQKIS